MVVSGDMGKLLTFKKKEPEAIQQASGVCQQGSSRDFLELVASHQIVGCPIGNLNDKEPVVAVDVLQQVIPKLRRGPCSS